MVDDGENNGALDLEKVARTFVEVSHDASQNGSHTYTIPLIRGMDLTSVKPSMGN